MGTVLRGRNGPTEAAPVFSWLKMRSSGSAANVLMIASRGGLLLMLLLCTTQAHQPGTSAPQCTGPPLAVFPEPRPSINCTRWHHFRQRDLDARTLQEVFVQCGVVAIDGLVTDSLLLEQLQTSVDLGTQSCNTEQSLCNENAQGLVELELDLSDQTMKRFNKALLPVSGPILDLFLEDDHKLEFLGAFVRTGSAAAQPWHADCKRTIFKSMPVHHQLPPHCVSVFVPLVDCNVHNGCTELLAGTHLQPQHTEPNDVEFGREPNDDELLKVMTNEAFGKDRLFPAYKDTPSDFRLRSPVGHITLNISAGSVLMYDSRVVHRAGHNSSPNPRTVVELNYCRPWYKDSCNLMNVQGLGSKEEDEDEDEDEDE